MFSGASNFVSGVDHAFIFIFGIGFFFLIGITATMIFFAIKYSRKRHPVAVQVKDNMKLEAVWTIIPIILVLLMFYYGYEAYLPQRTIPKDGIHIKVISKMWDWTFDYGNNKLSKDTLVVPINKPIILNMVSLDVNHSFYISAFRVKEDVVPGMTTQMWFIAEREGIYDILCAEFCGLRHSYMEGRVKVVSENEYIKWVTNLKSKNVLADSKGHKLIEKNGCIGCHTIDGSKLVGPTFKGLYGSERIVITNGKERKIIADSSYIKQSIYNPDADVVKDFNKGMMQSYTEKLKNNEVTDIIDYLKTIGK